MSKELILSIKVLTTGDPLVTSVTWKQVSGKGAVWPCGFFMWMSALPAEGGIGCPESRVTEDCELLCRYWELKPSPLAVLELTL